MNPIEELKTEHEAVRGCLRVLNRIATDIDPTATRLDRIPLPGVFLFRRGAGNGRARQPQIRCEQALFL